MLDVEVAVLIRPLGGPAEGAFQGIGVDNVELPPDHYSSSGILGLVNSEEASVKVEVLTVLI